MINHRYIMWSYHMDLGKIQQENTILKETFYMLNSKTHKVIGSILKSELNMGFIMSMIMVISTHWKCQEDLGMTLPEMKGSKEM